MLSLYKFNPSLNGRFNADIITSKNCSKNLKKYSTQKIKYLYNLVAAQISDNHLNNRGSNSDKEDKQTVNVC